MQVRMGTVVVFNFHGQKQRCRPLPQAPFPRPLRTPQIPCLGSILTEPSPCAGRTGNRRRKKSSERAGRARRARQRWRQWPGREGGSSHWGAAVPAGAKGVVGVSGGGPRRARRAPLFLRSSMTRDAGAIAAVAPCCSGVQSTAVLWALSFALAGRKQVIDIKIRVEAFVPPVLGWSLGSDGRAHSQK